MSICNPRDLFFNTINRKDALAPLRNQTGADFDKQWLKTSSLKEDFEPISEKHLPNDPWLRSSLRMIYND